MQLFCISDLSSLASRYTQHGVCAKMLHTCEDTFIFILSIIINNQLVNFSYTSEGFRSEKKYCWWRCLSTVSYPLKHPKKR